MGIHGNLGPGFLSGTYNNRSPKTNFERSPGLAYGGGLTSRYALGTEMFWLQTELNFTEYNALYEYNDKERNYKNRFFQIPVMPRLQIQLNEQLDLDIYAGPQLSFLQLSEWENPNGTNKGDILDNPQGSQEIASTQWDVLVGTTVGIPFGRRTTGRSYLNVGIRYQRSLTAMEEWQNPGDNYEDPFVSGLLLHVSYNLLVLD